ncbi:hypothetical protein SEMRO_85_G045480.1 [Seminavis robusta]|uniref:Uncharacterized protein n=1 Tax=Seminavis robusta TaxID=568900 RepID=A0A9N8H3F2_9STRA|nr:hypothetical protein SEMRO_85_G045480.1 [Seminavis robusta]|eukprot:Sro85_g045480.1 n/a (248) ;mRNA; r:95480-96307
MKLNFSDFRSQELYFALADFTKIKFRKSQETLNILGEFVKKLDTDATDEDLQCFTVDNGMIFIDHMFDEGVKRNEWNELGSATVFLCILPEGSSPLPMIIYSGLFDGSLKKHFNKDELFKFLRSKVHFDYANEKDLILALKEEIVRGPVRDVRDYITKEKLLPLSQRKLFLNALWLPAESSKYTNAGYKALDTVVEAIQIPDDVVRAAQLCKVEHLQNQLNAEMETEDLPLMQDFFFDANKMIPQYS